MRLAGAATVDGAAGSGPVEGGAGPCGATGPVVLYYDNAQTASTADGIDFLFKVANGTGAALPLTSLAIRYYFTNEITPSATTTVFYAGTCCGNSRSGFNADVHVSVNAMPPTPTADHYLETTFDAAAGVLLDGDSVQVEVGYHAPGFGQNLNQVNDYSFIATATGTQAQWDLCPTQMRKLSLVRDDGLQGRRPGVGDPAVAFNSCTGPSPCSETPRATPATSLSAIAALCARRTKRMP